MENSTDTLFTMIKTDPEEFLDCIDSSSLASQKSLFVDYFYKIMREKDMTFKQLSVITNISLSHIYQLSSGLRGAGRDNIILISIALGLDLEQTQTLLKLSHNGMLYPKVKRDAIIICCIECGMSVMETEEKLAEKSEKGLIQ